MILECCVTHSSQATYSLFVAGIGDLAAFVRVAFRMSVRRSQTGFRCDLLGASNNGGGLFRDVIECSTSCR